LVQSGRQVAVAIEIEFPAGVRMQITGTVDTALRKAVIAALLMAAPMAPHLSV